MSVYTHVTRPQLDAFFSHYHLGNVLSYVGIKEGMVNSNYFVSTTQDTFVLTLFEDMLATEVEAVVDLLAHLAKHQIVSPAPQYNQQGLALQVLNDKPALLCKRLVGAALTNPTLDHCIQIGSQLAKLHRCTQDYIFPVANPYDINGLVMAFQEIANDVSADDHAAISHELAFQSEHPSNELPTGLIHADLFRDNVLFENGQLSGLLDFYSACHGELLFDLAIVVNDWCCDDGVINPEKMTALLSSYQSIRPLEAVEKRLWPIMLRRAALRFWLSRLAYQCRARSGELVQQKDPLAFRRILVQHQHKVNSFR
jgi:homoserine kinase type II